MTARSKTVLLISVLALQFGLAACAPKVEKRMLLQLTEADLADVSFEHAKELLDQGKIPEAITAFRSLLRDNGASLPALNGLAIAHAEIGLPDLAAELFAKALAIEPDDPVTLNNIGYAALRRQDMGLARRYLEKAEQVSSGELKISGNLKVLHRLEAWVQAQPREAPLSECLQADALFTVQRQTALTSRLGGLQTVSHSYRETSMLNKGLIDFNDLFDPWQNASPHLEPSS